MQIWTHRILNFRLPDLCQIIYYDPKNFFFKNFGGYPPPIPEKMAFKVEITAVFLQ